MFLSSEQQRVSDCWNEKRGEDCADDKTCAGVEGRRWDGDLDIRRFGIVQIAVYCLHTEGVFTRLEVKIFDSLLVCRTLPVREAIPRIGVGFFPN